LGDEPGKGNSIVLAILLEPHGLQISKFEPIKMTTAIRSLPLAFHFLSVMRGCDVCAMDFSAQGVSTPETSGHAGRQKRAAIARACQDSRTVAQRQSVCRKAVCTFGAHPAAWESRCFLSQARLTDAD